jgi:hypothetical protein
MGVGGLLTYILSNHYLSFSCLCLSNILSNACICLSFAINLKVPQSSTTTALKLQTGIILTSAPLAAYSEYTQCAAGCQHKRTVPHMAAQVSSRRRLLSSEEVSHQLPFIPSVSVGGLTVNHQCRGGQVRLRQWSSGGRAGASPGHVQPARKYSGKHAPQWQLPKRNAP